MLQNLNLALPSENSTVLFNCRRNTYLMLDENYLLIDVNVKITNEYFN